MKIADTAAREADDIIGRVFDLVYEAVMERRRDAAWWYAYRSRRAIYARTKAARRWWLWLARRSHAQMLANTATRELCCAIDEELLDGGSAP